LTTYADARREISRRQGAEDWTRYFIAEVPHRGREGSRLMTKQFGSLSAAIANMPCACTDDETCPAHAELEALENDVAPSAATSSLETPLDGLALLLGVIAENLRTYPHDPRVPVAQAENLDGCRRDVRRMIETLTGKRQEQHLRPAYDTTRPELTTRVGPDFTVGYDPDGRRVTVRDLLDRALDETYRRGVADGRLATVARVPAVDGRHWEEMTG
jgi:hypothetical protein